MPLPMVHLCVAKNIMDAGLKIINLPQFYLGSISPDAIHMRQNADRLAKHATHLSADKKWNEVNEDDFFIFICDFIEKNKSDADKDFLWGYGLHILTDMYWANRVYKKFTADYRKDASPVQDERMAYYNDTDIIDQMLHDECAWKDAVRRRLQNADCPDFLGLLTAGEIEDWKLRTLRWYESGESKHKNPIKYITKPITENFIAECAETIRDKLITAGCFGK